MCKSCKKTDQTEIQRPICLELEDAKTDIFGLIDNLHTDRKIPFYMLESIVSEAARRVKSCADAERTVAMQLYEKQLAEQAKNEQSNV